MADEQYQTALAAELLEKLAAIEHQRWAHWQQYLHHKGNLQPDGSIRLPADLVKHWQRQIETPYEDLSDAEKESDREQVRKYFSLLEHWLHNAMKGKSDE